MKKEIACASITILRPDLIEIIYKNNYLVELEDAKAVDDVFLEFSQGNGMYTVMDTQGRYNVFSKEAQAYLAKEAPMVVQKRLLGFAIVIDNLPNRMLAKFYITFFKPNYPIKIFSEKVDARMWLDQVKEKNNSLIEV